MEISKEELEAILEIAKESKGTIAIYKEEIRRLNQAMNRKNYSMRKLREKLDNTQKELDDLKQYYQDDGAETQLDHVDVYWLEGVSENPDMDKADKE